MAVDRRMKTFICGVVEGFYGKPWNHHQRKILFKRMKKIEMNVYLYAPKDDKKHRVDWRELYSVEEVEQMKSLIEEAKNNCVTFVYAISPGIDITYSSSNDINCLKRKLSQVSDMGCDAFALLFDDIEPMLKSADKTVYKSIGQAQAELTNRIYCHLNSPSTFIFCPTEYCTTRAVPDVENSEYLRSIGSILEHDIDIMWTGRMVISKIITPEEMKALAEILQRPPLIWDNIHANDYDPKRVYLGPYTGRSPELRPLLRGILTNPNCEFEANFVAMSTLAAWSKADLEEVRKEKLLSSSPLKSDIQLEVDDSEINVGGYKPRQALQMAVNDWLAVMYRNESIDMINNGINVDHISSVDTSLAWGNVASKLNTSCVAIGLSEVGDSESQMEDLPRPEPAPEPIPPVPTDILDEDSIVIPSPLPKSPPSTPPPATAVLGSSINIPEPMEFDPTTIDHNSVVTTSPSSTYTASPHSGTSSESLMPSAAYTLVEGESVDSVSTIVSPLESSHNPHNAMETAPTANSEEHNKNISSDSLFDLALRLNVEEVCLLIDLCYLPYEHGPLSSHMLDMYLWLRGNAQVMSQLREDRNKTSDEKEDNVNPEVQEWFTKAEQFSNYYRQVCNMCTKLCSIVNISVLSDLYPYVSEVRRTLSLLEAYLKWLANGQKLSVSFLQQLITWPSYKECFVSGNYEAWYFRGGLVTEFLRMVPLEGVQDLLVPGIPEQPTGWIYEVRPYKTSDKESVYEIARRCAISKAEELPSNVAAEREIIGERSVGAFLTLSEDFCFVVEDQGGNVCGYAFGALCCSEFCSNIRNQCPDDHQLIPWLDHHVSDDSRPKLKETGLIRAEMAPALGTDSLEASRRLLACLFCALRTVGVTSVHCPVENDEETELYGRLGFSLVDGCYTRTIASSPQSQ